MNNESMAGNVFAIIAKLMVKITSPKFIRMSAIYSDEFVEESGGCFSFEEQLSPRILCEHAAISDVLKFKFSQSRKYLSELQMAPLYVLRICGFGLNVECG